MTTIADLEWKPHPAEIGGERAVVDFPNGYSASVLRGGPFYTSGGTYEIGVMVTGRGLTYDTPIRDDVLGHLSEIEANATLEQIAYLPARETDND
jgi:hypothetical protein